MRKQTALDLLELQKASIECDKLKREEWLVATTAVILRVFPLSAKSKIRQLERINEKSDFYSKLSEEQVINIRKRKAESYLNNYIEEIELLGTESKSDRLEILVSSVWFWAILICVAVTSYVAGSSLALTTEKPEQIYPREVFNLEQELKFQKNLIDSLKSEIDFIRTFG